MEYKVETKYGRGNSQALKIAADISAIGLQAFMTMKPDSTITTPANRRAN